MKPREAANGDSIDAYDAAFLALENAEKALVCIRTMLESDLWPTSADAFYSIIGSTLDDCEKGRTGLRELDPTKPGKALACGRRKDAARTA